MQRISAAAGPAFVATLAGTAFAARAFRPDLLNIYHLTAVAEGSGVYGWLLFGAVQIAVAAFGVLPASLLAIGAGLAYGFWMGFLISAISTLLGGWLAFHLSRSMLRPWIERFFSNDIAKHFENAVAKDGWRFVCLMRISPIMPFAATSYGLGLTKIDDRDFLIGTLASFPALLSYVALGGLSGGGLALVGRELRLFPTLLMGLGAIATVLICVRVQGMLRASLSLAGAEGDVSMAKLL